MSDNTVGSARTAVVVLGMHRSGTSALAGVLSILGCDEPATLMVPNENNEKGYFESGKLYQLHTKLFASAATYWDDWLPMPAGWFDSPRAPEFHRSAVEAMGGEFSWSSLFVLKDPRICRLVPFWEGVLEELGAAPRYVLTHRNPLEVAASLRKRDGHPTGLSLLIWLRHVLAAEAGTRGRTRCFISFGQLLANWAGVVEKIQTELGLKLPRFSTGAASEVDAFLEGRLKHHQEAPEKVLENPMFSIWVRDTYGILERWAAKGEDAGDHDRLDQIRETFDAAVPAFGSVVKAGRDEVRHLSERSGALSDEVDVLKDEKSKVVNRNDEMQADIEARDVVIGSLKAELGQLKSRLTDTEADLSNEKERSREVEDRLQIQFRELSDLSRVLTDTKADLSNEKERSREVEDRLQTQFRELSDLSRILIDTEANLSNEKERSREVQDRLQSEIGALRGSSSWRITQPLRTATDWVRRGRR